MDQRTAPSPRAPEGAERHRALVRGLAALCLSALSVAAPGCEDDPEDSVVRTADCSLCAEELQGTCTDTYTACIGGGETSGVCQQEIDGLCGGDGGADAGDGGGADAGDGRDAGLQGVADAP